MLEELLKKYDLVHSSIISGGKVNFNINFLLDNKVYVSIKLLLNNEEKKYSYDFVNDENFGIFVIPKIIQRFISKNVSLNLRKIMANDDNGTLVIERKDGRDSLIIRNCSSKLIDIAEILLSSYTSVSNVDKSLGEKLIFEDKSNIRFDNYMKCNTIFDYASYRVSFFKDVDSRKVRTNVKKVFDDDEMDNDSFQLLILNIARYAYTFEVVSNVWNEIEESYKDNSKVVEVCEAFKNEKYDELTTYSKALILAEYEKNNDVLFENNDVMVEEALQACSKSLNFFESGYVVYWQTKKKYYSSILDGVKQGICVDFLDAYDIADEKKELELNKNIEINMEVKNHNTDLISKFKKIKNEKSSFASIIHDPITSDSVEDEVEKIFLDFDKDKMAKDADEQARRILEVEMERDQLKKDAEEFAKIILKNEIEYKKIVASAEEQAKRIIELEKENEELKKLAQDNAKYLFERDKKLQEEEQLREYIDNAPVKSQEIDKINNLLNALSEVKGIDFTVNHPTAMQEVLFLEEKIITYLTTHKNIVHEEDKIVSIEKEEMKETKPVIELLALIRNTYVSSHLFEKDGRHTLIELNPVDKDTYRVTLYSIKDDSEDVLMDAFFEDYQLTDNVLKEICDIFSTDAVIVASKIDNVPPDKADYLVIDNMNNAIKFMDFKRDLIDKIKEFI